MTRNLAGEEGGTDPWARLLPMFCEILLSLTEPSLRLATISEIPRCDNQQLKDLLVVGSAEEAPRKGPPRHWPRDKGLARAPIQESSHGNPTGPGGRRSRPEPRAPDMA